MKRWFYNINKYVPIIKLSIVSFIVFWFLIFDNTFIKSLLTTVLFFILISIFAYVNNKPLIDKKEKLSKDPEWKEYQRLKKKFNNL